MPGTDFTDEDIEAGRRQASKQWVKRFGHGLTNAARMGKDHGTKDNGEVGERLLSARDFGRTLRPPKSADTIVRLCRQGRIKDAVKGPIGEWLIPEGAAIEYKGVRPGFGPKEGVSPTQYAIMHGVTRQQIYHLLGQNRIEGAKKTEHGWDIPPDAPYPAVKA